MNYKKFVSHFILAGGCFVGVANAYHCPTVAVLDANRDKATFTDQGFEWQNLDSQP